MHISYEETYRSTTGMLLDAFIDLYSKKSISVAPSNPTYLSSHTNSAEAQWDYHLAGRCICTNIALIMTAEAPLIDTSNVERLLRGLDPHNDVHPGIPNILLRAGGPNSATALLTPREDHALLVLTGALRIGHHSIPAAVPIIGDLATDRALRDVISRSFQEICLSKDLVDHPPQADYPYCRVSIAEATKQLDSLASQNRDIYAGSVCTRMRETIQEFERIYPVGKLYETTHSVLGQPFLGIASYIMCLPGGSVAAIFPPARDPRFLLHADATVVLMGARNTSTMATEFPSPFR